MRLLFLAGNSSFWVSFVSVLFTPPFFFISDAQMNRDRKKMILALANSLTTFSLSDPLRPCIPCNRMNGTCPRRRGTGFFWPQRMIFGSSCCLDAPPHKMMYARGSEKRQWV
ncbi:hypothetical protein QBC47DRAFT_379569 [Echria macrotheca]|uniref:Uncharacterized protein n=1 Tax=Echria macrotheca TaxID=438768 RepID=A0AAJ0BFN4_9PEZI|nr:hypothetical protein QBC47DRAFT_379569 [Echria macrotheca]